MQMGLVSGGMELNSKDYALIAADIRKWDGVVDKLIRYGFSTEWVSL